MFKNKVLSEGKTGIMHLLNDSGDWKLEWDSENKLETDQMRKTFDHNVKDKGFAAFRIDKAGARREQIHKFDKKAVRIRLSVCRREIMRSLRHYSWKLTRPHF